MAESVELLAMRTALPWREEHAALRATARRFLETECAPFQEQWGEAGMAPRHIWRRAGELGLLCPRVEEAFGGSGADFLCSVLLIEEQVRAGVNGPMLSLHSDIVTPYVERYGTPAQKARILPKLVSGEWIGALAMTEPGGGSDLRALRTSARRDGDHYVISGAKIFISNGCCADLIVLAARTGDALGLFLVEANGLAGFSRSSPLDKLGQHSADTAELFFDEARVPASALLGERDGAGLQQMSERLVEERLLTGVAAVAVMQAAIQHAIAYTRQRQAFGRAVIDFQNTRFRLAEAQTEAVVCRTYLERCVLRFVAGRLTAEEAAMLKWWSTEKQCEVVDVCLQLFGGYGYMLEYPIARLWLDSRVARIYGGSNETLKDYLGKRL